MSSEPLTGSKHSERPEDPPHRCSGRRHRHSTCRASPGTSWRRMRSWRPGLPIVVVTGCPPPKPSTRLRSWKLAPPILKKPYGTASLLASLEAELARPNEAWIVAA